VKIDILSIFPDYLAPLELSLPGKARAKGLLDITVHDLRDWTTDKHHTTDDTPYGGGAGMVMKPEPWGAALDQVATGATIIFTTPSGQPFTQAVARELSSHEHLVFACGRYEGIDQRVIEHAATIGTVREISLGDYVLNGGEVAALAITEAVVRLIPGFMGNAASLVEESHEDGLLEYPVYTKPASWRGHDVPDVLLSGDHARIARWRHEQAVQRTAERRPDLVAATSVGADEVRLATLADAGEILTLQLACWVAEQRANPGVEIHAQRETVEDVRRWLGRWTVIVRRREGRLIAAARGRVERHGDHAGAWDVGRLMVAPDLQGQGLGRDMLERIEAAAPAGVAAYVLFTGAGSADNLRMYKKAGYRLRGAAPGEPGAVVLTKKRRSLS
jgi:tRNA (guanine37-N1)-methyltransferase